MRTALFSVALATVLSGCTLISGFDDLRFDGVTDSTTADAGDAGSDDRDADLDAVVPPPPPDADAQVVRETGADARDAADSTVLPPVDADGPDADSATLDDSGSDDTGPTDPDMGPADDAGPDAGETPDAWSDPDTGPSDSGPIEDAWVDPDTGPVDSGPVDTGPAPDAFMDPDTGPADTGPADTGPPDTGPTDSGPPPCSTAPGIGCCDGTNDQIFLEPFDPVRGMVGCRGSETQCTAEELCAPGWHLCTYPEFANRGGSAVLPLFQVWLAGCARHADCSPIAPVPPSTLWEVEDAICDGMCSRTGGMSLEVGVSCMPPTVPVTDNDCPLGVVASGPRINTLGSSGLCSYVSVQGTQNPEGAACCR